MKLQCSKCGLANVNKNFCWSCGGKVIEANPTCKNGHEVGVVDKFCEFCGEITDTGKRYQDEQKSPIRENYEADEARETVGNAVQDSGFAGQMD